MRVLIIGGSFSGLSALKTLREQGNELDVTLVEPRAGFLNVMAIAKTMLDTQFASSAFLPLEGWNVKWDSMKVHSQIDQQVTLKEVPTSVRLHYVQGYVTELKEKAAVCSLSELPKAGQPNQLAGNNETISIPFDFCIVASGRARKWPFDPLATTRECFVREMRYSEEDIRKAKTITVIGGGALGIELAGEIKCDFPEKKVRLIHPHGLLPSEPLVNDAFKRETIKMIERVGVELLLNTRVASEDPETHTLTTTSGLSVSSDLNYWCSFRSNNVGYLTKHFPGVTTASGELKTTKHFQLASENRAYPHIFAVGDIVDIALVKTAGWALRQGTIAATNILKTISGETNFESIDVGQFDNIGAMLLTVGNRNTVAIGFDGKILIDEESHKKLYEDYRTQESFRLVGLR